jgi:phosphoadenosine phosphosulfate reductase
MYNILWDSKGIPILTNNSSETIIGEIRPVFHEELNLLGFNKWWNYPEGKEPLLWAKDQSYYLNGNVVAKVNGQGFFKNPEITIIEKNIDINPINLEELVYLNSKCLDGLVRQTVNHIYEQYQLYADKVDSIVVAFSGGKDSLTLIDLVQRSLSPDDFIVIFNDTDNEFPDTHKSIKLAQEKWKNLNIYPIKSKFSLEESWSTFGPPSRIHRWCRIIHKTIPTIKKINELNHKKVSKFLLIEGIRKYESDIRSSYEIINFNHKNHSTQINFRPILNWNSFEIFLYLFQRNILFNDAYRFGVSRVGCMVCPYHSKITESLIYLKYPEIIENKFQLLTDLFYNDDEKNNQEYKWIIDGGWKSRAGGRILTTGEERVIATIENDGVKFYIKNNKKNIFEWLKTIGDIHLNGGNTGYIETDSIWYPFEVNITDNSYELIVKKKNIAQNPFLKDLIAVVNKSAYCAKCELCNLECPVDAIHMHNGFYIDEKKCNRCKKCLSFIEKGCIIAKSMRIGESGSKMKGLDRYCTFGLRKIWLEEFNGNPELWFSKNSLGNKQFIGMKFWLSDAGIIEKNKITPIGEKLRKFDVNNNLTWEIIWINLYYNSKIVNWYISNIPWDSLKTKKELIDLLSSGQKLRTHENAINSLINFIKESPIGSDCKIIEIIKESNKNILVKKIGWNDPIFINKDTQQIAILYSLYKYSENIDRYDLSLSELYDNINGGPAVIFGIPKTILINTLRGMASKWNEYIDVEMVIDLDNIYLNRDISSSEVIDLL